ncbi:MAG: sulfatase [Pirellulaceae bacterium]|nr:MAG: sulfatase [Pirellulaceae bacterium]
MPWMPSRRDFLHVGVVGGIGLTLADYFRLQARADQKYYESKEGTAKSVIFIFLPGGMAHQESFDPKPYAPVEYRGPLGVVPTSVEGIVLSELWQKTAQVVDKIAICRSMTHGEAAHERGTHNMFTGYRPSPAIQYPSMGSVVAHEFGPRNNLPPYICIPNQPNVYAGTGYLSSAYAGFSLGADPASDNFTVRDLNLPSGIDEARFAARRKMLDAVNDYFRSREKADAIHAVDTFYERAYNLISSQAAREAFDINKEDRAVRDEYGRNAAGARMLLARRLVEAGARFVTLTYGGWDMHDNIQNGMRSQVPALDQAFATLIRDLDRRGLLDSTLVCIASEFGRTPKINGNAGRDHWPKVFSVVLAGGGIKRGIVYGKSDATASEPEEDPLTVEDWATTIYHCLGINADKELMAPGNRPIEIVDGGKVRQELLA